MRSNKKLVKEKSSTVPLTLSDIRPTGQYIYYIMIFLLSTLYRAPRVKTWPPTLAGNQQLISQYLILCNNSIGTGTVFYSTVQ